MYYKVKYVKISTILMRIAIFHELHFGGALKTVNEFSMHLNQKNIVDYYYIANSRDKDSKKIASRVYFFKFKSKVWKGNDWKKKLYKDTIELFKLNFFHKKIAQKINNKNYDFVFVHPSQFTQSPFLLKYLKIPSIYYCQEVLRIAYEDSLKIDNHDILRNTYESLNRKLRKKIDLENIKHAKLILANSKYTKKEITKAYKRNSVVAYLGVDINFFKPIKIDKKNDVLFIGSFDKTDGHQLLEQSLKYLKKTPILKTVNWQEKNISEKELLKNYQESKIVVCLASKEPFGLVALEAMSCGVPVIAINEGGYRETLISNKTGFLIPKNPKMLAEKIEQLLLRNEIWEKFQKSARKHIKEKWSWDKRFIEFESLINKFIKK